jgi:hypothetical protein
MDHKTGYLVVLGLSRGVEDPDAWRSTQRTAGELSDPRPANRSWPTTRLFGFLARLGRRLDGSRVAAARVDHLRCEEC